MVNLIKHSQTECSSGPAPPQHNKTALTLHVPVD